MKTCHRVTLLMPLIIAITVLTALTAFADGSTNPYSVNTDLQNMDGFRDNKITANDIESFIMSRAPESPMLNEDGIGNCFINAGTSNNINPAFLVATAYLEGGFGTRGWAVSHPECHNTFGWVVYPGHMSPESGSNCADSWCEMIDRVANGITSNFYDKGYHTIDEVRTKYAENSNSDAIVRYMNDLFSFSQNRMRGGDYPSLPIA